MKKSLLTTLALACISFVHAQTFFTDFTDQTLPYSFDGPGYTITAVEGTALNAESNIGVGEYKTFGQIFYDTISGDQLTNNLTGIANLRIKVKSDAATTLRIDLVDTNGNSTSKNAKVLNLPGDNTYHVYVINFNESNDFMTYQDNPVDIKAIDQVIFYVNAGGASSFTGNVTIDYLVVGDLTCPTVNAGPNVNFCSNQDSVMLNGSSTHAFETLWFSVANVNNIFAGFGDSSMTSTKFRPSNPNTAGTQEVYLVAAGVPGCPAKIDTAVVTKILGPDASLGPNLTICAGQPVILTGTIANATGQIYDTDDIGGTFSPNANALAVTFTPSGNKTSFYIELKTTGGNNLCPADSDLVLVTVNTAAPLPQVNAGTNQVVCSDMTTVNLNGFANNTSSLLWTTSGTGSFTGGSSATATYMPSNTDITNGSVSLYLIGNSTICQPAKDTLVVTFDPCTGVLSQQSSAVEIYPNPSKGEVNVKFNYSNASEMNVQIFNSNGQLVHEEKTSDNQVAVSNLKKGLYMLRIYNDKFEETKKLVVE